MALATRSFSVLETADKTWAAAADVNGWVLALPDAATKGWGDRWKADTLGPGAAVSMLGDAGVVQEWQIEEWYPARKLRLASRAWKGRPQSSMTSWLELGMTQISATETLVDLKLETRFDNSNWGWLLNIVVPLKKDIDKVLAYMERGIVERLSAKA